MLVKPDIARAQVEAERPESVVPGTEPSTDPVPGCPGSGEEPTGPRLPRRFFGTVEVNLDRAGRDMGQMAEEVLQHLTTLPGDKVKVTVEIDAEVPKGVSDDVQRVVNENCQTLRFKSHGFEES